MVPVTKSFSITKRIACATSCGVPGRGMRLFAVVTEMFGPDLEQGEKILAATTANNLIPRPGTPQEVAQAIRFVIENDFVTGTTVDVDGGALLP